MRRHWKLVAIIGALMLLIGSVAGCGGEPQVEPGNGDAEVAGSFDGKIVGIEPGAGIMECTDEALLVYDLDLKLQESSSAAMAAALKTAIENEDWIVVTGWTPHWKFAVYDLKYLDDPEGVYGAAETINTFVRLGLDEDDPALYTVLDNFFWTPDDIGAVMLAVNDGADPYDAAREWVDANPDKVAEWTEGVEIPEGAKAHLAYVEWDCAIASTHTVATVLEDLGYDVKLTSVDAGIMWQGVANGNFDGMTTAWLPVTHDGYFEQNKDKVVDLGPNYDGEAKIGLVVPSYVTIDSITELNDYL